MFFHSTSEHIWKQYHDAYLQVDIDSCAILPMEKNEFVDNA